MTGALIQDFKSGQDNRRSRLTAPPGSLWTLTNGHITRGGEIEKCKAFVGKYTLPAGTFGAASIGNSIFVFGSAVAPAMPPGVSYQRLQHPDGVTAMAAILQVDRFANQLYVIAQFADATIEHYYNGTRVPAWFDGRARASFNVTGGTHNVGVNKLVSVLVNGVEALSVAVDWVTDNSATAAAIATQINLFASTPEYTAVAIGPTVFIVAAVAAGATPNGFVVSMGAAGDVAVNPAITALAGGQAAAGTYTPGTCIKTFNNKMYSGSAALLFFSKIGDPTLWSTSALGAGFIDMSEQVSGSEELTAMGTYLNNMAVFAKSVVMIWSVVSDPAQNARLQIMANTGTSATRSVLSLNDNNLMYLSKNGIRSIVVRDYSNAATVSEIGTPIDPTVIADLALLSQQVRDAAVAVTEPVDNRYMLAVGQRIYVFSNFPGAAIQAWSIYEPGFAVSEFFTINDRLYARSGDTIYLYGGDDNAAYDASVVTVELPFTGGSDPSQEKDLTAIDCAIQGEWTVEIGSTPTDGTLFETVAVLGGPTYGQQGCSAQASSTHFSARLTHSKAEYAKLSNFMFHFDEGLKE